MSDGSLTISRLCGGSDEYIELRVTDEISGTTFLELQVGLAEFTEALTGLAHVNCRFTLKAERVGLRYEHKSEVVPLPNDRYVDWEDRPGIAAAAFAPFEVDGWKGRVDDLFNHHRRAGSGYRVTFTRYVNPETGEPA